MTWGFALSGLFLLTPLLTRPRRGRVWTVVFVRLVLVDVVSSSGE
jgi:hypothetical protein